MSLFDDWCTGCTNLVQKAREEAAETQSPPLELEYLWFAINEHRRTGKPWPASTAERLNAYIDYGARDMPDRVADLVAFMKDSLVADAQDTGL